MFPHPTDNTDFQFEYHGAVSVTPQTMLSGTSTTANTDTWSRADDSVGVIYQGPRIAVDTSTGASYIFIRAVTVDANGHWLTISAETRHLWATIDATAIECGTELVPDDASISGSLVTWLKADAIGGLSDGDSVTTWSDSASSNDAAQSTTSKKPIYKTGIYNSLPTVRFDGTDDYMDWGTWMQSVETGAFTMYVVAAVTGGWVASDYEETASGAPDNDKDGVILRADGRFDTYERSGTPANDSSTTAGLGSLAVMSAAVANDGSVRNKLYLDGALDTTDAGGGAISASSSPSNFLLGATPATTAGDAIRAFVTGDICEVIVYSATHTAEQVEQISCHLMTKWGI